MITVQSRKSLAEIARDFEAAAIRHGFGVLGMHDLRAKMSAKGVAFDRGCLVFEVCNPVQAKAVLEKDMSISTMLPCRISAYETQCGAELATIEPTRMIQDFRHPELAGVAGQVEAALRSIMNDVSR